MAPFAEKAFALSAIVKNMVPIALFTGRCFWMLVLLGLVPQSFFDGMAIGVTYRSAEFHKKFKPGRALVREISDTYG